MSFGIGTGDIIVLATLTWKIYRLCKDSSAEFQRISNDIQALHTALLETKELLDENESLNPKRRDRLLELEKRILDTLRELESMLEKYESLPTPAQTAWDRMRWGLQDVSAIRDRLLALTMDVQVLNQLISNSSLKMINKKLDRLLRDVQAGYREGSCISVQTTASITTMETWNDLRKELESIGLTATAISENRKYITAWFQEAISKGILEEQDPLDAGLVVGSPMSDIVPTTTTLSDATTRVPFDDASAGRRSSTGSITRQSRLASIAWRVFRSDSLLLNAASDGNADRVAEFIRKGANINVKDRWGWAPISMAAYGGHTQVARVLLDAGASVDYTDVDGDTPLQLATNKGHTAIVLMIEEELERRSL